jgi:hypothetical protein
MTSLFVENQNQDRASGHQKIPSRQHLQNQSRQLTQLLHQRNLNILMVEMTISSQGRRMNTSMPCWDPRRDAMKHLQD